MSKVEVEVNDIVQDKITKFKGYASARIVEWNGSVKIVIEQEASEDGKPRPNASFDIDKLLILEKGPGFECKPIDINMGDKVQDSGTKVTGIVTRIIHWSSGCVRVGIELEHKETDKQLEEIYWIDYPSRTLVLEKCAVKRTSSESDPPGGGDDPTRERYNF